MFSSNCVFDLLTQSTQFYFTVRCFFLSVFPQRTVFLTYKVVIGTKLVTIDKNLSFHCIQQSSILPVRVMSEDISDKLYVVWVVVVNNASHRFCSCELGTNIELNDVVIGREVMFIGGRC